jgi:tRNA pseudouridine55 synthase
MSTPPTGFLLLNKPRGITSHDVVEKVRQWLRSTLPPSTPLPKVGHAGTLDPLAEGLLILGIGKATKQLGRLVRLPKTYLATIALGATTATDDAEAPPQPTVPAPQPPSRTRVLASLAHYRGKILQRPPTFAAVKIKGRRAYQLARRGKKIQLKSRPVHIYQLKLIRYQYPKLTIRTTVSSGTYLRALARDLGKDLKTGGYLLFLRREAVGSYSLREATPLNQLTLAALRQKL